MDHYPVKRRGEKRQLNPNTEGIAWLDARAARDGTLTRVCGMTDSGVVVVEGLEGAPFNIAQGDWGWDDSRPNPRYVRPMFQPLNLNVLVIGGDAMICPDPCPNCYDFSYAWSCPDHGREGRKDAYATRPAGDWVDLLHEPLRPPGGWVWSWTTQSGTEVRWNHS